MSPTVIVPGAIKRNVYLFNDDHTEKRDTHLPDVEWVDDEITAEREARIAADNVLQANIDAEEARAKAAEATLQANIDAEEARAEAAEATLQANIDAEETRAKAAEATKENLSNKIASTGTYVSDDTHYATTALMESKIAELSPEQVKWATYDDTDFWTIEEWMDDGLVVMCNYSDTIYVATWKDTQTINFESMLSDQTFADAYHLTCSSRWGWEDGVTNLEVMNNKLDSDTSWFSDDNLYPTTAAVADYVANHAPKQIEWAQGTETNATLKSWFDAGKLVLRAITTGSSNEKGVYIMTTCETNTAHFDLIKTAQISGSPETYSLAYITVYNNTWYSGNKSLKFENASNRTLSTDTWSSVDYAYPSNKAVENYVAAHAPSGVEWATYGTTTYSQIKSWNDAGKPVFLKYTVSGPVDYILKLTIVTPGGAFFCGVQGISEYTAEVNPANQWSYNNPGLQANALVHYYETWDETDDLSYPSIKAVSNYIASHAPSSIEWATKDSTTLAQLNTWKAANKLVLVLYSNQIYRMVQCNNTAAWFEATRPSQYSGEVIGNVAMSFFMVNSSNTWTVMNSVNPEDKSNKLYSTSSWPSANDTKYPTCKSVENYVANHGGPIKIASTSNTATEIYTWQQAGNAVFLKESGDLYALQYCSNTNAYFVQLYVPDANTDPHVYWKAVSGNNWTSGNFYLQKKLNTIESTSNKLLSNDTWVSNDTKYPTTQSVANYVASHAGGDTYEIEGDGTIFFPVVAMDWDNMNLRWKLTHYPGTSTEPIYTPRTNFRLLKNGETFAFTSNHWLNIQPFSTSGTRTYYAGSNVVAPTTTWGTTNASASPDGSKIGACFYMSAGATDHNNLIGLYGKISPNTVVSQWHALDNFFWLELYDKTVSQTVPVCRKLMRFAPSLVGDFDVTGQTFEWMTAIKNICPNKMYMKASNGTQWYNGTVLKYANTNAAGNCHYFTGIAYNSSDGGTYLIRFSRQSSTSSYAANKITLT